MLVSRFAWWAPCQAVWIVLLAMLVIQLSGAENVCYLGACPYMVADHTTRSATHRMAPRASALHLAD
jgi:hypothetical protein